MGGRVALVAKAIVSGAAVASAFVTIGLMLSAQPWSRPWIYTAVSALGLFAALLVLSGLVSATVGLAWHAFASRHGWCSVHAYWVPALMVGAVAAAAPMGSSLASGDYLALALILSALGATLGGISGLVAWLIRRPDRDATSLARQDEPSS